MSQIQKLKNKILSKFHSKKSLQSFFGGGLNNEVLKEIKVISKDHLKMSKETKEGREFFQSMFEQRLNQILNNNKTLIK